MATIQKILNTNNSSYRVFIRKQGLKTLSKTFPTKKLAKEFALSMESDTSAMMSIRGRSSNTLFKHLVDKYLLKEYTGSRPKAKAKILEFWTAIIGEKVIIDITKNDIYTAGYILHHWFMCPPEYYIQIEQLIEKGYLSRGFTFSERVDFCENIEPTLGGTYINVCLWLD